MTNTTPDLTAVVLVGTLSPSPAPSSSELLARQVLSALSAHGVTGTVIRLVDHDIRPGVQADMGDGDAWPAIRAQILAAHILVVATPIWMGQPSSVTKRALERLDAELSEKDDQGRLLTYGKVAAVAVVGNEDGAHHVSAELFQALDDVGFTIPAGAVTYWVGRAMEGVDYQDLDQTPESVASTTATLAAHTAHLARLLAREPYPPS
ncbi:flavodoxin family protein [Cellulomonas fengjieae]|uniref:NAD(P)H-dependent oxidoreductase n=1 Tax=Cellulomonas fengjieae TaxID=2819978 RepID=A0ABS3SIT7_9CELL|nr:NAD(P)H-dependent oxidoreductase [Cellulomonas fengjieae]MBO3085661.1 NAD(P)H-dependent oxidoreductase [Cellulomonas fengjieae]QVI67624.1 NAD(P)H-dependent oxidoreductase [Cellulomonas fengjieae]